MGVGRHFCNPWISLSSCGMSDECESPSSSEDESDWEEQATRPVKKRCKGKPPPPAQKNATNFLTRLRLRASGQDACEACVLECSRQEGTLQGSGGSWVGLQGRLRLREMLVRPA